MRRLALLLVGLILFAGACSSSSDSSDGSGGESTSSTPAAGGDESSGDPGDGSSPAGAELVLSGPDGAGVAITVICGDPGRGIVSLQLTGGTSGELLDVEVGDQSSQIAVDDDGTGVQGIDTDVVAGTVVAVDFGGDRQEGELTGC